MTKVSYKKYLKLLAVGIIIILIYIVLNYLDYLDILRLKTQDLFWNIKYKITKTPINSEEVVLVAIDDEAYYEYNEKWPWGREIFAALIYKINKDKPSAIGMNLVFKGQTEIEEGDLLLREAFRDVGNVVLAYYIGAEGKDFISDDYFIDAAGDCGFTNKPLDKDDEIRYTKLFVKASEPEEGRISTRILDYAFEMKLLYEYYKILPEEIYYQDEKLVIDKSQKEIINIPVDNNGLTFLNYTVKSEDLNIVPILDVINDKVAPDVFKNKIVIVGTTGKIFHSENLTPFGVMSGIEVIANSLIMLLSGEFVYVAPDFINLLLFFLIISFGIYCFWRFGRLKGLIVLAGELLGFFIISVVVVVNCIVIDFFSIPVFIIISYLIIQGIKYSTLVIEGIKLKNIAVTDTLTGLSTRRFFMFRLKNDIRKALREKQYLSAAILSIDNFEEITSSLGADEADLLIKKIGILIKKNSRKSRRVDFIARYREYEFSVILKNTTKKGTLIYVNRIKNIIEGSGELIPKDRAGIRLSCGIVSLDLIRTNSAPEFTECARKAMERARQGGGGKVALYDKNFDKIDLQKHELSAKIDEADLSFVAQELNEKNKELTEMIKQLRVAYKEISQAEKLSAMGKLASSIHHELNNPLSALRSCLQTVNKNLEKQIESEPVQKSRKLINAALEELARMIEMNKGLKELYKPSKKVMEPVNINKLLTEIMDFLRGELDKKRVKVIVNKEKSLPDIKATGSELRQVFLNIILNALDSMSEGGKLDVDTNFDRGSKLVQIKITDTGCGMAPEILDKIFEPFSTIKEAKGAGLGLYITKQKIEQFGGKIEVESQVDVGTTFKITFPVVE